MSSPSRLIFSVHFVISLAFTGTGWFDSKKPGERCIVLISFEGRRGLLQMSLGAARTRTDSVVYEEPDPVLRHKSMDLVPDAVVIDHTLCINIVFENTGAVRVNWLNLS